MICRCALNDFTSSIFIRAVMRIRLYDDAARGKKCRRVGESRASRKGRGERQRREEETLDSMTQNEWRKAVRGSRNCRKSMRFIPSHGSLCIEIEKVRQNSAGHARVGVVRANEPVDWRGVQLTYASNSYNSVCTKSA